MGVRLLWSSAITVCAAILVSLDIWARDVSGAAQKLLNYFSTLA
jgi:hypothetical protein